MKAVFISYNQSLTSMVSKVLEKHAIRGYTQWDNIKGCGTHKGEPHEGNHVWPELNNGHLVIVPDEKVAPLLKSLKSLNQENEQHGLRAFVWNVEDSI